MRKKPVKKLPFGFSTIELLIVIVVIVILGSLIVVTYHGVQQRNHDAERKNDIVKLEGQVQAYQAETNKYPSVSQMNNAAFRLSNMKDLTTADLTDPLWKSSNKDCTINGSIGLQASVTPTVGCYGYDPSPVGCDNTNSDCTSYILTAELETGGTYVKKSLN